MERSDGADVQGICDSVKHFKRKKDALLRQILLELSVFILVYVNFLFGRILQFAAAGKNSDSKQTREHRRAECFFHPWCLLKNTLILLIPHRFTGETYDFL